MRDRIQKLLDAEHLTAAKFAEFIGVQPSSISHILKGRNKPSSEFIQRVLSKFPSLSAEWLVLGSGDMYKVKKSTGNKLFHNENPPLSRNKFELKQLELDFDDDDDTNTGEDSPEPNTGNEKAPSANEKRAVKIIVFYSDNSFQEFTP
jgi:transcriptional regulator with XRE-family HTH domain